MRMSWCANLRVSGDADWFYLPINIISLLSVTDEL